MIIIFALFPVNLTRKEKCRIQILIDNVKLYVVHNAPFYHLNDEYVPVKQGDVLIFNPGIGHESIIREGEEGRLEYFVGLTDVSFCNMRENQIELKDGSNVLHTSGKMRREIFQLCEKMEKENQRNLLRIMFIKIICDLSSDVIFSGRL